MPRQLPKLITPAPEFCGLPTYTLKTSDGSQYRCFNVSEVLRGNFHDRRVFVSVDFAQMLLVRGDLTYFRVDRVRPWRMYHNEITNQTRTVDVKIMVAGSITNVSYIYRRMQSNFVVPRTSAEPKVMTPAEPRVPKVARTWAIAAISSIGELKVQPSRYSTEEACKADMEALAKKTMSVVVKIELQERCIPATTLTWR